ncbi:MAG: hypothetical protein R3F19_12960 [Verrucomicrobiales bacterium]
MDRRLRRHPDEGRALFSATTVGALLLGFGSLMESLTRWQDA